MKIGIGTEAALFPEKEYIMEISFAVRGLRWGRKWEIDGEGKEVRRK
jgi:hypothetical protein